MKTLRTSILLFFLLSYSAAHALDVCGLYKNVHQRDIVRRIKSGIPFKLLSIAGDGEASYKTIAHIKYDLWSEVVTIDDLKNKVKTVSFPESEKAICQFISFPNALAGKNYHYQLHLNPIVGDMISTNNKRQTQGIDFLKVNWRRIAKDLETEKVLLEIDIKP